MSAGVSKTTVLVVEPDNFMRLALTARLEEHPYVEVVATADGVRTALSKIDGLQPDWVVVDLCRDTEEGLSMLEAMHDSKVKSRSAAIAHSGLDGNAPTIKRAKAAGAGAIVRSGVKAGDKYVADDVGRELLTVILRAAGWRSELDRWGEPGEDVLAKAPSANAPSSKAQSAKTQSAKTQSAKTPSANTQSAKTSGTKTPAANAVTKPSRARQTSSGAVPTGKPDTPARAKEPTPAASPSNDARPRVPATPSNTTLPKQPVPTQKGRDAQPGTPAVAAKSAGTPGICRIVGIGVSTGGPLTLHKLLPRIPEDFSLPILIVQHMPANFTKSLAQSLDRVCPLPVAEAQDGDVVTGGRVLIAPGGRQMRIERAAPSPVIRITDDPPECSCRPSVDYLFRSLAETFGRASLGVVLTGMGEDGWLGSREIHSVGGKLLAQDEASCAVFGMPRGPIKAGIARAVSLDDMADAILAATRSVRCS